MPSTPIQPHPKHRHGAVNHLICSPAAHLPLYSLLHTTQPVPPKEAKPRSRQPSAHASARSRLHRRSSQPIAGPQLGPLAAQLTVVRPFHSYQTGYCTAISRSLSLSHYAHIAQGPSLSSRALQTVPPISARMVQQLTAASPQSARRPRRRQPSAAARQVLPHWSAR